MLPSVLRVFVGAGFYFALLHELLELAGVPRKPRSLEQHNAQRSAAESGTTPSSSSLHARVFSSGEVAVRTFAASALARTLAISMLSPISVVKTRLEFKRWAKPQSQSGAQKAAPQPYQAGGTIVRELRSIVRAEGVRGLFVGVVPTVMRDAPFSGTYYLVYDALKQALVRQPPGQGAPGTLNG